MKLTICTLIAGIAAATAVQASDTRVFGERIMLPEEGSFFIGRISADGSAVLGNSTADYLIPNDLNGTGSDTFFHDTATGQYHLASLDQSGAQGSALMPVGLSSDGGVALMSDAYNSHAAVIFRKESGTVEHLPVLGARSISGDGETIAFVEAFEGAHYITLYELATGEKQRLPFTVGRSTEISLSQDARFVGFNTRGLLAPGEPVGKGLDVYRYDVDNDAIARVPFPSDSDAKMGNLSSDGSMVTYSSQSAGANVTGGWIFNFDSGAAERFCQSADNTLVSANGEFVGCERGRTAIEVKKLSTGQIKAIDLGESMYFQLGGLSNTGTAVWGTSRPATPYDTNGKVDLFITKFNTN